MAGIDIRAGVDTETFKALLLLNGGGAVALLTLFAAILDQASSKPIQRAILWGVVAMIFGLVVAVAEKFNGVDPSVLVSAIDC